MLNSFQHLSINCQILKQVQDDGDRPLPLNLELWLLAMADGDAPFNASTSQRINQFYIQLCTPNVVAKAVNMVINTRRVSILATHEKWQLDHLVDSLNEINKLIPFK